MTGLMWTKKLSVGNEIVDAEHRNLIRMTNDVAQAIRTRDGSALAQAFELLENWLCVHFTNEEKIAEAVKFDFSSHKLAQQYSLKELRHMRDELIAKNGMGSDGAVAHFTRSLKNWMIDDHIINLDMLMKPALQAYDYKFWPGRFGDGSDQTANNDCSPIPAISSMGICGYGRGCDSCSSGIRKPASSVFARSFSAYPA